MMATVDVDADYLADLHALREAIDESDPDLVAKLDGANVAAILKSLDAKPNRSWNWDDVRACTPPLTNDEYDKLSAAWFVLKDLERRYQKALDRIGSWVDCHDLGNVWTGYANTHASIVVTAASLNRWMQTRPTSDYCRANPDDPKCPQEKP